MVQEVNVLNRLFFYALVMLALLMPTLDAEAQSEGIELEHSPNGRRALQKHEETRIDLQGFYNQANETPSKRFQQTCERHVARYVTALEREVRDLTRKGSIQEAEAVQQAIQRAERWTVFPPNHKGIHFLSQTDLEVKASEKATKLGVDLLVNIETAAQAYTQQSDKVFELYQAKIVAAREVLAGELNKALDIEQRAGRLEAVQEIKASLESLKQLPEILPPGESVVEAKNDDPFHIDRRLPKSVIEISDAIEGFYSLRYTGTDRRLREALIELSTNRCVVLAQYYTSPQDGSVQWDKELVDISVSNQNDTGMTLRFTDYSGSDVFANLTITTRYNRTSIESRGTYSISEAKGGALSNPQTCYLRKLGYRAETVKDFEDGDYIVEMDLKQDPDGKPVNGRIKFRLQVIEGTFMINQRTSLSDPNKFEDCMPTIFRVRAMGGDTLFEAEYTLARQQEMFVQRTLQSGEKEIQLWWDRADYQKGEPADAFGTINETKE